MNRTMLTNLVALILFVTIFVTPVFFIITDEHVGVVYALIFFILCLVLPLKRDLAVRLFNGFLVERRLVTFFFIFTLVIVGGISTAFFRNFPITPDEHSYIFQARLFASHRFSVPSHPMRVFFPTPMMINNGRYYSKYPPGHPLMLAIGVLLGSPSIIPPILAAVTVVVLYFIGKEMYDRSVAIVAGFLLISSPYFLLTSSTLLSNVTSLFFLSLFTLFYLRTLKHGGGLNPMSAGLTLGMAFATRPATALAYSIPFVIHSILSLFTRTDEKRPTVRFNKKLLKKMILIVLFSAILLLDHLCYNLIQTGDPFLFPFYEYYPGDKIKLVFDETCYSSTLKECAVNTIIARYNYSKENIERLIDIFVGWPINHLTFIIILFFSITLNRWDYVMLSVVFSIIALHSFYWFPGVQYTGPVYYYETILPLLLLTSRGIIRAYQIINKVAGHSIFTKMLYIILLVTLVLSSYTRVVWDKYAGCGDFTPCSLSELTALMNVRRNPTITAETLGLNNAVIFMNSYSFLGPGCYLMNSPDLDDPLLFFIGNGNDENKKFMEYFQDRECYIYNYNESGSTMTECGY